MTRKFIILLFLTSVVSCSLFNIQNRSNLAKEKTSPFSKIDFKDDGIYVEVDNERYRWLKMGSIEVSKIVDLFKENYSSKWQERFSADFVEYLNRLDIYPKQQELFSLVDAGGNTKMIQLKFSSKKRNQAQDYYKSVYDTEVDLNQVLTRQEALEDLDQLEQFIKNKYAYAFSNNVNVNEEIQTLKKSIPDEITSHDFALQIGRFLNKFGDGHSRIKNVTFKKNGVLPFSVQSYNEKVICTKDGKLLNDKYPFLHAINDIKCSRLLELSAEYFTPDASPQFKKRVKVARLNRIGEILKLAGSVDKQLKIELASEDGQIISLTQEMSERNRRRNTPPIEVKHFEDIGYLGINFMMELNKKNTIAPFISKLKNKKGLIIDVRGNGGGSRDILVELAPHFINKQQGFVVGNVAQLRTNNTSQKYDLSDRYLYQIDDDYFDEAMKLKLKSWSSEFSKTVLLNDSLYSSDYFLCIEGHEEPIFSNTPTVILLNDDCFSATDIFLSTFKEINGVTLIGTASGGGSGRARVYKLQKSSIEIKLSSIVSFQPNGELYDGIGVQPDVVVPQSGISDILKQTDSQLDFALKFLNKKLDNR